VESARKKEGTTPGSGSTADCHANCRLPFLPKKQWHLWASGGKKIPAPEKRGGGKQNHVRTSSSRERPCKFFEEKTRGQASKTTPGKGSDCSRRKREKQQQRRGKKERGSPRTYIEATSTAFSLPKKGGREGENDCEEGRKTLRCVVGRKKG